MRILLIVVIILIFLFLIFIGIGNYFVNLVLSNKKKSKHFLNAPHNLITTNESDEVRLKRNESLEQWFLQHHPKSLAITSFDGLKLHSIMLVNEVPTQRWVILNHGYTGSCKQVRPIAKHFYHRGFNILTIDARAHGESTGSLYTMGYYERMDMERWIDVIISKQNNAEIILYGISMGAATVLLATGDDVPKNVKAVIEDCAYSSFYDELNYQIKKLFHIPGWLLIPAASFVLRFRAGIAIKDVDVIGAVRKSSVPTLFIHGQDDQFIPVSMGEALYQNAACPKQWLAIDDAGHAMSQTVNPHLYWKTVDTFLQETLGKIEYQKKNK